MILFLMIICGSSFAERLEPVTLAVNDLNAQGVKESDAAVISEQLRAELMKSRKIQLVERSQMQEILKEQGFQQSGCTSDACAVEIGQLIGVKNIIVGSVGAAGSYTVLSIRVIDVRTGSIIVNESVRTKGGIDKVLEKGIEEASDKLLSGLLTGEDTENAEQPVVRKKTGKAILIGCGVAVLAGGGVAAALFLKKDSKSEEPASTPNTRIELP
ncbi:MAG TPA: CsgG/HfaB family protein [Chitinispirillaceae bacterium]|nr:CsgG/HfaB family protein [Chitinispirillaceae bacterium]